MQQINIEQNPFYELAVSTQKNRIYLKIIGFWRNEAAVPNYLKDWNKALGLVRKDFTVLTDATQMKIHPPDVRLLHEQAQAAILKAGVSKVAEILTDRISEIQLDNVAKVTLFPKKNFISQEEAEKWLDT